MNRRNFVKLAGLGGVVFTSGLARGAVTYGSSQDEFFFVQLSDTHWGFQGPAVNPDAAGTLPTQARGIPRPVGLDEESRSELPALRARRCARVRCALHGVLR